MGVLGRGFRFGCAVPVRAAGNSPAVAVAAGS